MTAIKTASWFVPLPADHVRIGISRGIPRNERDEDILTYRALAPGPWFRSVSPKEYQNRFGAQLARLDAGAVVARLQELAGSDNIPVLCCFEVARDIAAGRCWCHRHLVAAWLERSLDITVEEVDWPELERFRFLTDPQPWRPNHKPLKAKSRKSPKSRKPLRGPQLDLFCSDRTSG